MNQNQSKKMNEQMKNLTARDLARVGTYKMVAGVLVFKYAPLRNRK